MSLDSLDSIAHRLNVPPAPLQAKAALSGNGRDAGASIIGGSGGGGGGLAAQERTRREKRGLRAASGALSVRAASPLPATSSPAVSHRRKAAETSPRDTRPAGSKSAGGGDGYNLIRRSR